MKIFMAGLMVLIATGTARAAQEQPITRLIQAVENAHARMSRDPSYSASVARSDLEYELRLHRFAANGDRFADEIVKGLSESEDPKGFLRDVLAILTGNPSSSKNERLLASEYLKTLNASAKGSNIRMVKGERLRNEKKNKRNAKVGRRK